MSNLQQLVPNEQWIQGSLLPHGHIDNSNFRLTNPVEKHDLLILISQDCDIVNPSYDAEPNVEVLIARLQNPNARNGMLFEGKNPRRLQFEFNDQLFEVNIHEKQLLDRHVLLNVRPLGQSLEPKLTSLLARWCAKRYTRPAFPDAFNRRRRKAMERIRGDLEANGHLFVALFAHVEPMAEQQEGNDYKLTIFAVISEETRNNGGHELIAIQLAEKIETALNSAKGIRASVVIKDETQFSLQDLLNFPRLDFDDLSYRTEDQSDGTAQALD